MHNDFLKNFISIFELHVLSFHFLTVCSFAWSIMQISLIDWPYGLNKSNFR